MAVEKNKPDISFSGPVFLIGMPRSGTKLLRNLLVEHPRIGILHIETEFLPYWVDRWNKFGDLSSFNNFQIFYTHMIQLPYFIHMRRHGTLISQQTWYELCRAYDPASIFEALVRHDACVDFGSTKIWGDKSPSYIRHLPLLKQLFPNAKFIHITRDVRDYCLSIHKAWGKNMIRAAQRWADYVHKASQDSMMLGDDYYEIKYEELIDDPGTILKAICDFLGIEFKIEMLDLSKPTENLGDTKGTRNIVSSNKEKYQKLMNADTQKKIEMIAAHTLSQCGYPVIKTESYRVPKYLMTFYQIMDGINLVRSKITQMGVLGAIKFYIRYFLVAGIKRGI